MRGRGTSRVNSSTLGDVMNILPWYPLAAGDRRSALVTGVQYLLRAGGSAIVADGTFGPATEERVRRYQWGYGLRQDGVAGQQTWCFVSNPGPLWPLVAVGDTMETNWRVRAVQHLLVHPQPGTDRPGRILRGEQAPTPEPGCWCARRPVRIG